MSLERL